MTIIAPVLHQKALKSLCFSTSLAALLLAGCQQEPTDKRIKQIDATQVSIMAQSIESSVNPKLADGLSLKIWGVDSLVADPISIDIDDKGQLYYTRTNRQKNSEFDIRGHQEWEIGSIQLKNVEEKQAFLHKTLSPENSAHNEWLADLNGDGSHDWKDMTVEKENVYRLEDTDGDGLADLSQLVVDDFNDETTDVAGAVLKAGDDLFVGVAPDLWRIKDQNGDGLADEKTSISHGFGIHVGFGGHGMSGLEMGPDGRIYWGIGDIGFSGEGPDGKKWEYPNRGVIVRANPDGSDFEVFAMGLRNTHEFVFDEYGNLISEDNDGDHRGESERLVYIVNGSDTGWRTNWQFGKYNDPKNNRYKVWMDEEMYKPRFEGQAAYFTPTIANFVNGPTGMLYNPGTALNPDWKNTFFVVEFVGNPARSGIHSFKLKPKGAGFELGEHNMIVEGLLATGIDFGPDGAMYVADWIEGWNTKDYGRIWKLDADGGAAWKQRQQTEKLLKADFNGYNPEYLGEILKNPDMRVRQKAQFELAKRGQEGADIFKQILNQPDHQLARVHAIWGISQMARMEDQQYAELLMPLLKDSDPEIRAQAAKWLGDVRYPQAGDALIPLLQDQNSRARFFAAEALGRIAYEPAVQPVIEMLKANNDEDVYLRHAGSLALARIGKAEPVVALANSPSRALRIAAVVALRRMQEPGIARFLNDEDEYVVAEAARGINDDLSIEAALPALGDVLQHTRFTHEALIRRAISANLRIGTEASMQNLIDYSLDKNHPVAMRREAIDALSTWTQPSVLDRVDGRYRGEVKRDAEPVQQVVAMPLIGLLKDQETTIRTGATEALGALKITKSTPQLMAELKSDSQPEVREAALRSLAAMDYPQMGQAIKQALADKEKNVRVAGLDLLATMDIAPDLMVSLLSNVIDTKTTEEKQAALLTLGTLPADQTQQVFDGLLTKLEQHQLPEEIHLELIEAIDSTRSSELKAKLEKVQSESGGADTDMYQASLLGGDSQQGQLIFFQHTTAQCMRCHSYDDMGGNAGPRLNGVGSRLTREQLLEALINPSARLAPGFGIVTLTLKDGKTVSGILENETDDGLLIRSGNQPEVNIEKKDIAKRTNAPSSMPNMTNFLTKREIRDLVSFLTQLKEDDA